MDNMEKMNVGELVEKIFRENDLYYYFSATDKPNEIFISVCDGDWKHDHLYLEYIMKENGFVLTGKDEQPSDEDCYDADYIFTKL